MRQALNQIMNETPPEQEAILAIGRTHIPEDERAALAQDVMRGLSTPEKRLSSRFFYDAEGSVLFKKIMGLPEYYLPRSEQEILASHKHNILNHLRHDHIQVIDLGAGDGSKTELLLQATTESGIRCDYHPVDVSSSALEGVTQRIGQRMPEVNVQGWLGEYQDAFQHLTATKESKPALVLFLGSNIGNFAQDDALSFLNSLRKGLGPNDCVLIGFDKKKDVTLLQAAYDDAQGVTAAFNYNLLHRINRELEANFDVDAFQHYAQYNGTLGRMESYLISQKKQSVRIDALETSFEFEEQERIHTESSYKYSDEDIAFLAEKSGFKPLALFEDEKHWFADALWST